MVNIFDGAMKFPPDLNLKFFPDFLDLVFRIPLSVIFRYSQTFSEIQILFKIRIRSEKFILLFSKNCNKYKTAPNVQNLFAILNIRYVI